MAKWVNPEQLWKREGRFWEVSGEVSLRFWKRGEVERERVVLGDRLQGVGGTKISGKGDCGEGDAMGGTGQEGWRRHMVKGRSTSTHTHNASF